MRKSAILFELYPLHSEVWGGVRRKRYTWPATALIIVRGIMVWMILARKMMGWMILVWGTYVWKGICGLPLQNCHCKNDRGMGDLGTGNPGMDDFDVGDVRSEGYSWPATARARTQRYVAHQNKNNQVVPSCGGGYVWEGVRGLPLQEQSWYRGSWNKKFPDGQLWCGERTFGWVSVACHCKKARPAASHSVTACLSI